MPLNQWSIAGALLKNSPRKVCHLLIGPKGCDEKGIPLPTPGLTLPSLEAGIWYVPVRMQVPAKPHWCIVNIHLSAAIPFQRIRRINWIFIGTCCTLYWCWEIVDDKAVAD